VYNLTGKVALITGAGGEKGLGRAIANRLAKEGADVCINDISRKRTEAWHGLESVANEIKMLGRNCIIVTGDVSKASDVKTIVETTLSNFSQIDILVNNAGAPAGPDRVSVVDLSEDEWDKVQNINIKGVFLMSREVVRHMLQHRIKGKIINMSSVSGKKGSAKFAAYCSSKFAVLGFTQSLALEVAKSGINVNAICPGLVNTERTFGIASGLKPPGTSTKDYEQTMLTKSTELNPSGRLATTEDVANVVAFLSSSQSDYLNGISIPVAGGSFTN
jgi:NAD(P)-dependent dehydrogenase (short-subunit alcohol dehydrogenase family)|tara:strand:- start:1276 stop:2100 length:825 start_codon:yes stop_codon:yes gene_type:complete